MLAELTWGAIVPQLWSHSATGCRMMSHQPVGAIIQGEEHGSPLVQVLRGQADFLRGQTDSARRNNRGRGGSPDALSRHADHDATVIVILAPFAMEFVSGGFFEQ